VNRSDKGRTMLLKIIKKFLIYACWTSLVLGMLFVVIFFFGGRQVGVLEARLDLWRGRYAIHGYRLEFHPPPEMFMLKAYGIEYRHVAGCAVNNFIIDRVAAYNATMKEAIQKDLHVDVNRILKFCHEETDDGRVLEDSGETASSEPDTIPDGVDVFMNTLKPEDVKGSLYEVGDCFRTEFVDLDGDADKEEVCLRYLKYKEYDHLYARTSLVVDVFTAKKHVLRHEIDRAYFFEERFVSFKDIDGDGRAELITRARFSPNCAGCDACRIFRFHENRFELELNLFGIGPDHPSLKGVMMSRSGLDAIILARLKEKTKTEHPCGLYDWCSTADPWLVDSDHDGQPEILVMVKPFEYDFNSEDLFVYGFIARYSAKGKMLQFNLIPIQVERAFVDVLGFLTTRDQQTHMLVNISHAGTDTGSPVLNIFDIRWPEIQKIGEFGGFYEHVIAERLQDMNGDGNTEIIYVKESYWPHDKPHADMIMFYGAAEYRDGRYMETDEPVDDP